MDIYSKPQEKSSKDYTFKEIETKWQHYWEKHETFKTEDKGSKPKYYILDMFPYPSGNGLHVGHAEGYTATDIFARFQRMKGFNVLHPMGWDAFGLPAEQYAIKTNTHPRETTEHNINTFRKQIKSLGYSTDWSREVNTTDPGFYKWTQWIFLKLFENGLAYESNLPVNWCPALGTVLANEEVIDGKSEVGGYPVEKKSIRQWVLKITEFAEELLEGLDEVDWPESTKMMQRNWIGKSKGAQVRFQVKDHNDKSFEVFTTRPDTLFGATFCVLAPEHPLVAQITAKEQLAQVKAYTEAAKNKTDLDRTALDKEKSGIFIGAYAVNPVNKKELPIYIADYVLMDYGLGAIMAVPGHDERDHEFAKKYALPIVQVLKPKDESSIDIQEKAFTGDGILVQSGFLDGLDKAKAIEAMISHLEKENLGKALVTYRLRDWIFSRQRYWGEPFPLAHDKDGKVVGVSASELPVLLPDMQDFKPSETGEPPLSKADNWLSYSKDGKKYLRETNIMPQWAGSCWYYLRYIDPFNTEKPWDPEKEKHWLPVDLYVGGVEHANLHLLYARFWHKVLYRLGYVSTKEPFKRLIHQGLILGPNSEKMSKSRGNVINPDDVIYEWGSDSLRLYEMFMGPIEAVKPWQTQGIAGVHRFLKRAWTLILEAMETSEFQKDEPSREMLVACHKLVKKVSEDTYDWKFNTAISAMMEFINLGYKDKSLNKKTAETFILLLAPYAPHLCEELWQRLGHKQSLAYAPWPSYQESLTVDDNITLSVMVNGKLRGSIEVAKNIEGPEAIRLGKSAAEKYLDGKTLIKEIYVPGKIVNFVVKD